MSFMGFCPAGVILPFGGSAAPEGWLLCDGSAKSSAALAGLFAAIGYNWGNPGGGSFNIPDLRGSFVRGAGTSGARVGPAVGVEQGNANESHGHSINHGHSQSLANYQFDQPGYQTSPGYAAIGVDSPDHGHGGITRSFNDNFAIGGSGAGQRTTDGNVHTDGANARHSHGDAGHTHSNAHRHYVDINSMSGSSGPAGGAETRPYSKGVNYIIKI